MGQSLAFPPDLRRMFESLQRRMGTLERNLPVPMKLLGQTATAAGPFAATTAGVWEAVTDTNVIVKVTQPSQLLIKGTAVIRTNNAGAANTGFVRLQSADGSWIDNLYGAVDNTGKLATWTHHPFLSGITVTQPGTWTFQWAFSLDGLTTTIELYESEIAVFAIGAVGA